MKALLMATVLSCSGCTVVGAVVGSSIPKREPLPETAVANRATVGQPVDVETRDRRTLSGAYGGTYDDKLWVQSDDRMESVPSADVKRASAHHDDYFLEGLLAGIAVDATVIAVLGATASSWLPKTTSAYSVGSDGVNVAAH